MGVLLSRLKLAKTGDLYLPGDMWYVELAEKNGLVESKNPLFYFVPVILVKKGNPKQIQGLEDLLRPGVQLGLGDPEACAIGRTSLKIFEKNDIELSKVKKNLSFSSLTVNELGIHIKTGKIDAAIVWDSIASYYAGCTEIVRIPLERNVISRIGIALLKFSKDKELAGKFIHFLASEEGKQIFKKHNYTTELSD